MGGLGDFRYDFVPAAGRGRTKQVSRAVHTGWPLSLTIRMWELTIVRPADKVVASPVTMPSVADLWCVQFRSTPTTMLSGPALKAAWIDPKVSASTALAPPWSRPYGWVLPTTGIVPTTRSADAEVISMPIFSASAPTPSSANSVGTRAGIPSSVTLAA